MSRIQNGPGLGGSRAPGPGEPETPRTAPEGHADATAESEVLELSMHNLRSLFGRQISLRRADRQTRAIYATLKAIDYQPE